MVTTPPRELFGLVVDCDCDAVVVVCEDVDLLFCALHVFILCLSLVVDDVLVAIVAFVLFTLLLAYIKEVDLEETPVEYCGDKD